VKKLRIQSKDSPANGSRLMSPATQGTRGATASRVNDRSIAEDAVSAPAQRRGVASGAAGEVEHRPRALAAGEVALDEVDVAVGLAGVAMGVELQILLAEPVLVPGHRASSLSESTQSKSAAGPAPSVSIIWRRSRCRFR
jgi:hypothetical protein